MLNLPQSQKGLLPFPAADPFVIEKSIQIQFVLHQPVGGGKVDTAQHRIGQQGNQHGAEIEPIGRDLPGVTGRMTISSPVVLVV